MNREFEEWLDSKLKKHAPDGKLRKENVASLVTEALTELVNLEQFLHAMDAIKTGRDMYEQAKITKDWVIEVMSRCCGADASYVHCPQHFYGCSDMRTITIQVQSIIAKWESFERDSKS